jgi:outer membrane protein TolC
VNVNAQGTYQSETVNYETLFGSLPPSIASEIKLPAYSKDLATLNGQVKQVIFDGEATKFKKENAAADANVKQQNLEVNLYALRDRVNQVFFGVLLIDEQLKQNDLQQKDIQNGVDKTQALVDNGMAYRSNVDELKAQLLQTQQSKVELNNSRKSYLLVLGLLINQTLGDSTALLKPEAPPLISDIKRPELQCYELQKKSFEIQSRQLETGLMPQIYASFDGYYGRPTLNPISNDFGPYWIAGIHLNWTLSALYTMKNSRRLINLNQSDLDVQKETFLFNTRIMLTQDEQDIKKYGDLLDKDKEIVDLRNSVKNASSAQLQNGVITSHDYLTEVDAEALARQTMILHEIQLLQAEYNHQNTSGN